MSKQFYLCDDPEAIDQRIAQCGSIVHVLEQVAHLDARDLVAALCFAAAANNGVADKAICTRACEMTDDLIEQVESVISFLRGEVSIHLEPDGETTLELSPVARKTAARAHGPLATDADVAYEVAGRWLGILSMEPPDSKLPKDGRN